MFSEMIHAFFIYYRFIPSYVLFVCSGVGASKNRKNSVLHYAINHLINNRFVPSYLSSACVGEEASKSRRNYVLHYAINLNT